LHSAGDFKKCGDDADFKEKGRRLKLIPAPSVDFKGEEEVSERKGSMFILQHSLLPYARGKDLLAP